MIAFDALRRRLGAFGLGAITPLSTGTSPNQLPGVPQLPRPFEGGMNMGGPSKYPGVIAGGMPTPTYLGGIGGLGRGGMEGPFSGPFNVPNMGTSVPNMGTPNALMGYGGGLRSSGFGFQEPRKYGVRQRY